MSRAATLWRRRGRRVSWNLKIELEPRDLWIGLYWNRDQLGTVHLFVCLVPALPVHLELLSDRAFQAAARLRLSEDLGAAAFFGTRQQRRRFERRIRRRES